MLVVMVLPVAPVVVVAELLFVPETKYAVPVAPCPIPTVLELPVTVVYTESVPPVARLTAIL